LNYNVDYGYDTPLEGVRARQARNSRCATNVTGVEHSVRFCSSYDHFIASVSVAYHIGRSTLVTYESDYRRASVKQRAEWSCCRPLHSGGRAALPTAQITVLIGQIHGQTLECQCDGSLISGIKCVLTSQNAEEGWTAVRANN